MNDELGLVGGDGQPGQESIEAPARAKDLEPTRKSVAEMDAGLGRPAEEMLAEMRRVLDERRAAPLVSAIERARILDSRGETQDQGILP